MIIRKLFDFNHQHIVRNCTSERCSYSLHSHSYRVEIKLSSNMLDNAGMVVDFGLLKGTIKELIKSWDNSISFWDQDHPSYVNYCQTSSDRWISLPVNSTAEQMARIFFLTVTEVIKATEFNNGEGDIRIHSVVVHETDTGYAEAFWDDVYDNTYSNMAAIPVQRIIYSPKIVSTWSSDVWQKICTSNNNQKLIQNPIIRQQVV